MDLLLLFLLSLVGFFSSFYGAMAGGGALLLIPALIFAGVPVNVAVATNRFTAIFSNGTSALRFRQFKLVKYKGILLISLFLVIGSIIGASLLVSIEQALLEKLVALFLLLSLFLILLPKKFGESSAEQLSRKELALSLFVFFILGIYGGFFGAGVGTMLALALIFFYKLDFLKSAAYARPINMVVSIAPAIIFAFVGLIDYYISIPLIIGRIAGAWLGATVAAKKGNRLIKPVFIVVIVAAIIKLLY